MISTQITTKAVRRCLGWALINDLLPGQYVVIKGMDFETRMLHSDFSCVITSNGPWGNY